MSLDRRAQAVSSTFFRGELHALVWSEPTQTVAALLGISDVGLAKVCRKYLIAKPPRGYWAQAQAGRAGRRPPLTRWPETRGPDGPITIGQQPKVGLTDSPQLQAVVEEEREPEAVIVVSESLTHPHRLIREAGAALRAGRRDGRDVLRAEHESPWRAVRVTRGALTRGLCILDALFKAAEARGYSLVVVKGRSASDDPGS